MRAFLAILLLAACGKQERPKVFEEPPEVDRVKMVAECMEVLRAFGRAVASKDDETVQRLSQTRYRLGGGAGLSGPFQTDDPAVREFFAYPAVKRLCAAALESDPKRVTFHDRGCKIRLEKDGTTFTFNMSRNDEAGYFVRMIGTE
jgi:hypothetical protein